MSSDLEQARREITASSAANAPFIAAFALTLGATGLLAFRLPARDGALLLLFQGMVAIPLAALLQRRLAWGRLPAGNPLRPLQSQIAAAQLVGMPAVLIAWAAVPWAAGAVLASVAAAHLMPYAWLHRSRVYLWLGPAVSVGTAAIVIVAREAALPWSVLAMAAAYAVAAALLLRHARDLAAADGAAPRGPLTEG